MSDNEIDSPDEMYDPQKKWKLGSILKGRFMSGKMVPRQKQDQCFDNEVLEMINYYINIPNLAQSGNLVLEGIVMLIV